MDLFKWFRKPKPEPPMMPNPELTEAERKEIAALLDGADQLSATLKILYEKKKKMERERAQSIRGIK